jgi:putative thioredoxin
MKNNYRFVFEATAENFNTLVLQNSDRGPVLVSYWAPSAGPCMVLMPRLMQLSEEYGGKFLLVLLNTEQLGRMARDHGVTSIPTVKIFRQGKVVHTIHGAESDQTFRQAIDRFVARESDRAHAAGVSAYQQGNVERAYNLMAQAALDDPDNLRIPLDLAKIMMLNGDYARAEDLLMALPQEVRESGDVANLLAHLGFLRVAAEAPARDVLMDALAEKPDDLQARYQLSALKLIDDDYAGALEELLEIVRRDREFRSDAGRRGMVAIFNMLGNEHELVIQYRPKLYAILN